VSAPANSQEVVASLGALTARLYEHVRAYADAERDAVALRAAADLAESTAFLAAEGAMEMRKHTARVAAADAEEKALEAEAKVRSLKAKIRALETDIEVHRTYGATVRAELRTLGIDGAA
jgi:hypothetical protein